MIPYTPPQVEAILREGHSLIEAGAGSGKTTTLTGKILYSLGVPGIIDREMRTEPLDLSQLAAITFTRKAATELKSSLRAGLHAAAERSGDPRWRKMAYRVDEARIGTIHSFCGTLLREFGLRGGVDPDFSVLDEGEASVWKAEAVRETIYRFLRRGDVAVGDLVANFRLSNAESFVMAVVSHAEATDGILTRWDPENGDHRERIRSFVVGNGGEWTTTDDRALPMIGACLRLGITALARLESRMDESAVLDFDALTNRTLGLLRNRDDVVEALQRRLRWLFIDEFQDTDPAQKEIAYRICGLDREEVKGGPPWLCVIGDPKQSIYRFRGADVSLWNEVGHDFGERRITPIHLDTNFRSTPSILGFVNAVFGRLMSAGLDGEEARSTQLEDSDTTSFRRAGEVRYHALRPPAAGTRGEGSVEILALVEEASLTAAQRRQWEAETISRRLLELRGGTVPSRDKASLDPVPVATRPWSDFALLFRTRLAMEIFRRTLERHGIPFQRAGGDGFFKRREVLDLKLLLRALFDPHDDIAWTGVLRSPLVGIRDDTLARIRLRTLELPVAEVIRGGRFRGDLPEAEGERLTLASLWLREVDALKDRVPTASLLTRSIDRSGYLEVLLLQEGGARAVANVEKLVRMAERFPGASLSDFLAYIEERENSPAREPDATLDEGGDAVTLVTIHQAKGLEWPIVALCDLDARAPARPRKVLLNPRAPAALDLRRSAGVGEAPERSGLHALLSEGEGRLDQAEAKRILYVATTRAKERLLLPTTRLPRAEGAGGDSSAGTPRRGSPTLSDWLLDSVDVVDDRRFRCQSAGTMGWGAIRPISLDGVGHPAPDPGEAPSHRIDPHDGRTAGPRPLPTLSELRTVEVEEGRNEWLRRVGPVRLDLPPLRYSASALSLFDRNREEYRRLYLHGLPPHFAVARQEVTTTGDILHGAMEELEVMEDLDRVLDRVAGIRLEDPGFHPSVEYRGALREMIASTLRHDTVSRILDSERSARELTFTWFVDVDGLPAYFTGAVDLAGYPGGEFHLLDYKSHDIPGTGLSEVAARHLPQRQVYAAALADITGTIPSVFTFLFPGARPDPETGDVGIMEKSLTLNDEVVKSGKDRILALLRTMVADSAHHFGKGGG